VNAHPTQEDILRAEGKIRLAAERLVGNYPLHAALVGRFRVIARPLCRTMAVQVGGRGDEILLLHSPGFVLGISVAELVGLLLHEALHVLFGHLTMAPEEYPDRWALTVAQEVTANEFVGEALPGEPVTLDQFPQLPPRESTRQRYARLAKVKPRDRTPVEALDDHTAWPGGSGSAGDLRATEDAVRRAVEDALTAAGGAVAAGLPQPLRDAIHSLVGAEAVAEARAPGSGGRLDWRRLLRRYVGQAVEVRPVFGRPPRRFPDLAGVVPGRGRQAARPRVLAVLDTSASITPALLTQIDGELRRLARTHRVLVAECDDAVRRVYPYRPLEDVLGRGGTDLRPPLRRDFLREHRPDVVVYFTDGWGPAPDSPPRVPVIWCIVGGGEAPAPWGRLVSLE
jgi:hypothetical protein